MKYFEILRPHEEATEHDVCDAISGEVSKEEVNLVAPAGVHQEHRRHEVLVPRGVRGDVAADRAHRLPVLPAKILDVFRKIFVTSTTADLTRTVVGPHRLRAPHSSVL